MKKQHRYEKKKEIIYIIIKIMKMPLNAIQRQFNQICLKVYIFQIGEDALKCCKIMN